MYENLLLEHNAADKEMWEKRKEREIEMAHQNIEDDNLRKELMATDLRQAK
jgi:hypothetical protein